MDLLLKKLLQAVEVSLVRRSVPVQRNTDHVPHVVVRGNDDIRRTLDQSTRRVSGTNRTFGHHAQIPSP